VRHHLSKLLKKLYGFTGYFQLYRMPIGKLKYVDYCEQQDLFIAGGMKPFDNLYDTLSKLNIPFHISDWHLNDDANYHAAEKAIENGKQFLFVYTASFDGMLHNQIGDFQAVSNRLETIKAQIRSLYRKGAEHADEVHFTIISDHGMTPLTQTVDVMSAVENSGLVFGRDYGACYDSTMARFHYISENARAVIEKTMHAFPGHFLTEEEEKSYGIYRADRFFGDAVFLFDAGIQIIPSDMGEKPLNGMHGFAPEDEHSFAAILSNTAVPEEVNHVADYFNLMIQRAKEL
jgi:hypothetical protein